MFISQVHSGVFVFIKCQASPFFLAVDVQYKIHVYLVIWMIFCNEIKGRCKNVKKNKNWKVSVFQIFFYKQSQIILIRFFQTE